MYSTGVVLVEMLTALGAEATESERLNLIADAKRLELPATLTKAFPKHAALARELLSSDPGARPTAAAVLAPVAACELARGRVREKRSGDSEMHARRLLLGGGGGGIATRVGASARGNIGVAVAAAAGAAAAKAAAGSGSDGGSGDSSYVPPGYGEPRATTSEIEAAAMRARRLGVFVHAFAVASRGGVVRDRRRRRRRRRRDRGSQGERRQNSPMRRIGSPKPLAPATVLEETEGTIETDSGEEPKPDGEMTRDDLEAEVREASRTRRAPRTKRRALMRVFSMLYLSHPIRTRLRYT